MRATWHLVFVLVFAACGDSGTGQNTNENNNGSGVCGDGELDPSEQCDDGPQNSDTRPGACRTDCRSAHCGDGVIDEGEQCEESDLAGSSCQARGFSKGLLACNPETCQFDESGCTTCGDGVAELSDFDAAGYETCDGTDLRGQDCISVGQAAGLLACTIDCEWDIGGCSGGGPDCGNGVVETGEECDGTNLAGQDCSTIGQDYNGGALGCSNCSFDITSCYNCGNGVIEEGEECDDGSANSDVIQDACRTNCNNATCGDGVRDTGEDCDGLDLGVLDCAGLDPIIFTGGQLSCTGQCNYDDSACTGVVVVNGVVWSPGADLTPTLEVNRFPLPNALVYVSTSPPAPLPQTNACLSCSVPSNTLSSTNGDSIDGSFQLSLTPGQTVYLTIQKGFFRRTRQINVPNSPGYIDFSNSTPGTSRPEQVSLPVVPNPSLDDYVPQIAVIDTSFEDVDLMFEGLGFTYNGAEVVEVNPSIVNNAALLAQYNIILVPSGENWPGGDGSVLRTWVEQGGTLFVDSFNYDFVEVPWPDFLSWYDGTQECGTAANPTDGSGNCNNWSSYVINGLLQDSDTSAWSALPAVNSSPTFSIDSAWNYLYTLSSGQVGIDPITTNPIYGFPSVVVWNESTTPLGSHIPAMVEIPYYCGRVYYAVYHYHTGYNTPYELLPKEKLLFKLLTKFNGC